MIAGPIIWDVKKECLSVDMWLALQKPAVGIARSASASTLSNLALHYLPNSPIGFQEPFSNH